MLGYKDRSLYLQPEHLRRVVPGGNGMFKATVVEHGRIAGIWSRKVLARSVRVTVSAFGRLPARSKAAVEIPAAQYAAFLGKPLDLRFD